MTAGTLLNLAEKWADILVNTDGPCISTSIFDSVMQHYYGMKTESAKKQYNEVMGSVLNDFPQGLSPLDFDTRHVEALNAAFQEFGTQDTRLGTVEDFERFRHNVETELNKLRQTFDDINKLNIQLEEERIEKELAEQRAKEAKDILIAQAERFLEEAKNDLDRAKGEVENVIRNRESYTSQVEVRTKHRRRMLGLIVVSPHYTSHYEARFDQNIFDAALANAETEVAIKELRVRNAEIELDKLKNN
jgi:hypothetical protein